MYVLIAMHTEFRVSKLECFGFEYNLGHSYRKTINPWRACAARVTVVVVCVCRQSFTEHLTSRAMNRLQTVPPGIGKKVCRVFSETAAFVLRREN